MPFAFFLTAILAACGRGSPSGPTPQESALPVFSDLRIVGSSTTLSPGTAIQLRAEASVWAESALDQGATFYFTLKACPPA
jgi:hypothetical protein